MPRSPLQITLTSRAGRFTASRLTTPLQKILRHLAIIHCDWHILLVRDAEMQKLHQLHLNDPTTTDVLTFDMRDNQTDAGIQLESVLCVDEARRRAAELAHTLEEELLLYALHSLLHVQGYNDITPAQSARMHAREDQLLAHIGIGPIYHPAKRKTKNSKIETRNSSRRSA